MTGASSHIVFNEIEFYCDGEKRTGVTAVDGSEHYRDYTWDKTLDGNVGTYFANIWGTKEAFIVYDLQTPCSLTKVRWADRGGSMAFHTLTLSGGESQESLETIASWDNGATSDWQEHVL